MATDILTAFGYGGGYNDPNPMHTTSDAFKLNFSRAIRDICGSGGIMRSNYTFEPDGSNPNTGQIDRLVACAAKYNNQVLLSVNVRSPTSPARVPVVNSSGVMAGYKSAFNACLNRYAGPNAVIKAGSTITLDSSAGGEVVTIPSTWQGIKWYECWNEPQSIGDCGGALNIGGSAQGRPWYDLVYIMNRDFADTADAHAARGAIQIAAFDIGGLEWDYLMGGGRVSGNAPVPWGRSKGFNWNRFDAFSMHCYVVNDPLANNPTNGPRGNLNTLKTHMRPKMDTNGADQVEIWITEGGHGGSLQLSNNTEYRNRYNQAVSGHFKDISWGHAWTDSGKDPGQQAGDETHPQIVGNYITKLRNMNVNDNVRTRMCVPHMFVRAFTLSSTQGNDVDAWHQGRCVVDTFPADPKTSKTAYTDATGTGVSKSSPDWLPGGKAVYLTRIGGGPSLSAPANSVAPTISDPTPQVGQTETANVGTWSGNPNPTFSYQWIRDTSTAIAGATGSQYVVTNADLGHTLKVTVTGTNSQGTASATSAASAQVTAAASGAPVNVTPPVLTTAGANVSTSNPPHVGVEIQTSAGTYNPAATTYNFAWERSDGTIL